jgi:tetratricopeptide (TPR) repeat protein
VGVAHSHLYYVMGHGPTTAALASARAAIDRALALDDRLAEAHSVLAVLQSADWQFAEAERSLRWAIALNPNEPSPRHWLAMFPLLVAGRFEEALDSLHRAHRLDPLSLIINADIGGVLCMTGQHERAITQCTESLRLDPHFARAHVYLGWARAALGRHDAAVVALETAARIDRTPWTRAWLGHGYGTAGRTEAATAVLREFLEAPEARRQDLRFFIAVVYAGLGDRDTALAWLARAVDERSFWAAGLGALPAFTGLRADPRFAALVERIRSQSPKKPSSPPGA